MATELTCFDLYFVIAVHICAFSGASSKSGGGDCGTCKEEVEREEAEALAQALAVSERQDPCPVVPGLTPTSREEVITIRIQPDTVSNSVS